MSKNDSKMIKFEKKEEVKDEVVEQEATTEKEPKKEEKSEAQLQAEKQDKLDALKTDEEIERELEEEERKKAKEAKKTNKKSKKQATFNDKLKNTNTNQPMTRNQIIRLVILLALLIGVLVAYAFNTEIFGPDSVFNQSISSNKVVDDIYHKIPAVIRTFQIVVLCICIFKLIKVVMSKGFGKTNKQITIIKLAISFLRWIIAIVAILLILAAWGVDTTTLLASAGILALVIGLGAQSLIADIIAGIFIVFEGDYQVGDIVVIDGWRGTVEEIGIRTTKVSDAGGNVKIVNNSKISSIVNQTHELSVAKCYMSIDYDESLERVELILKENLPLIKEHIPAIIDGPYYKGVAEFGPSSVNLLFMAICREEDIYQVQRDLNREMYLIFNKNDISIPFDQIVVSERESIDSAVSRREAIQAKRFAEKQAELSKGIEDKPENE